jgi:hypothetical protein
MFRLHFQVSMVSESSRTRNESPSNLPRHCEKHALITECVDHFSNDPHNKRTNTNMPADESTNPVFIEPDEVESVSHDVSVLQMARGLLALSGKGQPLPSLSQFRPLRRPQTFTPSKSKVAIPVLNKKRDCVAAISDDEEHCVAIATYVKRARREMPAVEYHALGGHPSSTVPLGRPLSAPPRLPRLPPGQALPFPMRSYK